MGVFKTLFLLFASQALAAPVDGQEGTKNAAGQNGILHLPLVHFAKEVDARDIEKRGFSTPLDYFKYDGERAVTAVGIVLDVGTPPQKVILEPDTGSSKFWLLGLKPGDTRGNGPSVYFDQKQSQSLQDLNKEDGASYGSGERVTYNMVTDKVSFEVVLDKGDLENGKPLTMGIDSGAPAFGVSGALGRLLMPRTGANFKLKPRVLEFGCDVVDAKASFDFKMSDKTVISIPLSDLLWSRIDNGKTCQLAVQGWNGDAADLWIGGHFLRRSLVVYDPDNKNVYVARGADCGSNLVAIDGKMPDDAVIGECKEEAPDSNAPTDEPPNTTPVLEEADIRDA
ncbi:peptidase A1family protein [Metarhizium robertsii]|uniref:Candidapepsin-4 n=2 Tax=Metarhizium robertsii TaxID=568076 RepID=E9F5H8_METRA|nr:candidapepsin-4 precursor [Metarhizium robertsii ARSEF 23]EFY96981.1 candidapepsin-4 precursor [Metarhizium robertsii ARSEF 23]EXU99420.1 peptidase A1family protein [Metarhizium robertsii]